MPHRQSDVRLPSDWNPGEGIVAQLADLLADAGADVHSLLASVGIKGTVREFVRGGVLDVSQENLHRTRDLLTRTLAQLLADRSGRQIARPADWRHLFFCLVNSRTLREAIERASDAFKVMDGRCGWMFLEVASAEATVRIDSLWLERTVSTFAIDALTLALFIDIFGWLIAEPLPIARVSMCYPAEFPEQFDAGFLVKPLVMNTRYSGFSFPSAYLDFPVTRTTDDCEAGMQKMLRSLFDLDADGIRMRPVERARRLMARALRDQGEFPSLHALSDQLGCSKSQLRRWLAQEGMSYNAMKISSRRELALDLLRRSQFSIEDISTRLGFWNGNAFRKVFRQWTNLSPTEFRKRGEHAQ